MPVGSLPYVPFGENASSGLFESLCPSRHFYKCFNDALEARYRIEQLYDHKRPTASVVDNARRLLPNCSSGGRSHESSGFPRLHAQQSQRGGSNGDGLEGEREGDGTPPERRFRLAEESFVVRALRGSSHESARSLRKRLHRLSPGFPRNPQAGELRCASSAMVLNRRALVLLGIPTSHNGRARRDAARQSWMNGRDASLEGVVGCFVMSAHYRGGRTLDGLVREAQRYGDILFVDAPETKWLITQKTGYSKFQKYGRGMPTFKQFAFFRHASMIVPSVPFVGKIDDDTIPNVNELARLLHQLHCFTFTFIGQINWAGLVPRSYSATVRADRCSFGWGLQGALHMFGKAEDMYHVPSTPCDKAGSVLPFPYASGAGYIFSAPLLRWLTSSRDVVKWVEEVSEFAERCSSKIFTRSVSHPMVAGGRGNT